MAKKKANLFNRLHKHFSSDPAHLPVVLEDIDVYERPNLHVAIAELLDGSQDQSALVGIVDFDYEVSLARLSRESSAKEFDEGPVAFTDVPLANGEKLACVKEGLYFFENDGQRVVLLVTSRRHSYPAKIGVEVMTPEREHSEKILRKLMSLTRRCNAYRGHVLSLERDCYGGITVKFHSLPRISRDEIILPESVLRRIERHTTDFSRHVNRLRQAGRHIKRGILLHGLPGTGKTLSAMYLVSQMRQRTVLLMTGAGMGSIETACSLARMLEPSTVVLEDVDLIGTRREHQAIDANALLFELLNQMDGLADDADILFILTTNRPDILEPALSARPGRIDQAIEIPLPDAECRRRLLELYGRGLKIEATDREQLVERTASASAAFIRELLRKAAVFAAVESEEDTIVVRSGHFEEALAELLVTGGDLTKSLLGMSKTAESTD
jgi:hypothetical protein